MEKHIKYNGVSTEPDDYLCPDGDLEVCDGLVHDGMSLRAAQLPVRVPVRDLGENDKILCLHTTSSGQRNIIMISERGSLWYHAYPFGADAQWIPLYALDGCFSHDSAITCLGNTICITGTNGIHYFLFNNGLYQHLGTRPPFVTLRFGLSNVFSTREQAQFLGFKLTHPDGDNNNPDTETKQNFANFVYGALNETISKKVTEKGYFYQPFFVRYALRMFDGTHILHSAPVLLIPSASPVDVHYYGDARNPNARFNAVRDDFFPNGPMREIASTVDIKLYVKALFCTLRFQILSNSQLKDELKKWNDVIDGIDIFVSPQITFIDQSKPMDFPWWCNKPGFYSKTQTLRVVSNDDGTSTNYYLSGNYGGKEQSGVANIGPDGGDCFVNFNIKPDWLTDLTHMSTFYKIAELTLDDILGDDGALKDVNIKVKNLSNLTTREQLEDDSMTHATIKPQTLYAFNSRLHAASVDWAAPKPLPFASSIAYRNSTLISNYNDDAINAGRTIGIDIYSVHDNQQMIAQSILGGYGAQSGDDLWKAACVDLSDTNNNYLSLPRFYFHPDAQATRLRVYSKTDGAEDSLFVRDVKLTRHALLNGAYYFAGFSLDDVPPAYTPDLTDTSVPVETIHRGSDVYVSQVNNPFFFPSTSVSRTSGQVLAVAAATMALSQNQFGALPLYSFTTEGIWAMQCNSAGDYVQVMPVSRDVLLSPSALVQLDNAIIFATSRGLAILSGMRVKYIALKHYPTPAKKFLMLKYLNKIFTQEQMNQLSQLTQLSDFINEKIVLGYDYDNNRLLVSNPEQIGCYCYSLDSSCWTTTASRIRDFINVFPGLLCVSNEGEVQTFDEKTTFTDRFSLITRPCKIDGADILKTIQCLRQRGILTGMQTKMILYGSRDLVNWHVIDATTSLNMTALCGTPYKFFKLAFSGNINPDNRLDGFSLQLRPRLNNKLR